MLRAVEGDGARRVDIMSLRDRMVQPLRPGGVVFTFPLLLVLLSAATDEKKIRWWVGCVDRAGRRLHSAGRINGQPTIKIVR